MGKWMPVEGSFNFSGFLGSIYGYQITLQQGYAICRLAPDEGSVPSVSVTPARTEALEYILNNSIDEYNETYPVTQTALTVLRHMLEEMQRPPAQG